MSDEFTSIDQAQDKVRDILVKYDIAFVNSRLVFPVYDKQALAERMMIDMLGLCYAVGNAVWQAKDSDSIRAMNGEIEVLKQLLRIMKYAPYLELDKASRGK